MTSTLKLTVVSYAGEPRSGLSKQFTAARSTVGRGADNDWILPDPEKHLSSRHCIIERRDNNYIITDVSKNGVFLNGTEQPLGNGAFCDLANGDTILIGDYQLRAEIGADVKVAAATARSYADLDPFPPTTSGGRPESPFGLRPDLFLGDSLPGDPRAADPPPIDPGRVSLPPTGFAASPLDAPSPRDSGAPNPDHVPAMGTFFRAPDIQAPIIPLDWDPLTLPAEPAPEPVTPPLAGFATSEPAPSELPAAPANAASTAALFHAFLEGAGLPNANIEADDPTGRMRAYGEILRELISGVRELLAVRTLTKSEFRIEQTMIRPAGNNPLKFSVDLDQAVSALLLPQRSGYTEPLPATREAIADLKSHEVSLIAGMQSSVAKLLAALSPDEIEKHVELAGILGSLVPAARKARYWEAYAATFDQVTQEYHEDVQSSFRRAFADAYFDQAKKL